MKNRLSLLVGFFLITGSFSSHAYQSVIATGDILNPGQYQASLEAQFITQHNSGANLVGRFDGAINRDLNYRALIGFGATDFHLEGMVKWIPFPDIDKQPAIGLLGGVGYAQYDDAHEISLRVSPLVSKKFAIEIGDVVPYASLPIGLRSYNGETTAPVNFALGGELRTLYFQDLTFAAEIGFNVSQSVSYISFAALYRFGDSSGTAPSDSGDVSGF